MKKNFTSETNLTSLCLNSTFIEIDNDYSQHEIYNEIRRNNSKIESWHYFFGVFGISISIFGILGKLFS